MTLMISGENEAGSARQVGFWSVGLLGLLALLAVVVPGSLALCYSRFYPIHHDLAGIVLSSRLAAVLGDAFDTYSLYFPPAERAWYGLAVGFSELVGIRLDLAAILITAGAVLFSAGLAFHIRRQTVGASGLFLVVSCILLALLPILFKNIFGLREHMVILGLWPYVVLRASDPEGHRVGWRTRAVVGLWLGAALLLKYFYSLVVLLVELADAGMQRRPAALVRIENVIAGGIVALYLFFWLVIDPAQRAAISVMLSGIEGNLNEPFINLVLAAQQLVPALVFLMLARIKRLPARSSALGLAMVAGAIVAAWIQGRWYSHHLFPITMAYLAWAWLLGRDLGAIWLIALALLAALPIRGQFHSTARYQDEVREADLAMERAGLSLAGKRVGLLNMHPSPFNQYFAAVGALRWNVTMNNAYVAAELKPFDRPGVGTSAPIEVKLNVPGRRQLHDDMLRFWEDRPPDALILDESTSWPLEHIKVRWTDVFAQDSRFKSFLADYRPVFTHSGKALRFTYYERIEPVRQSSPN
ncbi:hypothetical protein ACLBKT_00690 [Erythrobacter sp. W302b]|uniref:hypothetical protein n=1 Tax=Erythrobacter sp. W302b TaxID=3389874 RepID=UPI00396B1E1E